MTGAAREIVARAVAAGRKALLETEALDIAREIGIGVPEHLTFRDALEAARVAHDAPLRGERVVIKVLSREVLHKSDAGGVRVVPNLPAAIGDAVREMEARFAGCDVAGWAAFEFIEHATDLGGEFLAGIRRSDDFGPVVTLAPGGVHAEFLAAHLSDGRGAAIFSPRLAGARQLNRALEGKAVEALLTRPMRGRAAPLDAGGLEALLRRLLDFARSMPPNLAEFEINPLVLTSAGPLALDALARIDGGPAHAAPPRPLDKLPQLLAPRSVAIVGVSERRNPGRIILENMIRAGYDRERIFVVKAGRERFADCRCVPELAALPEPVDLCVLAIDGGQIPETLAQIVESRLAETVVVIPGGLGERPGTESRARRMRETIERSRATAWRGPLINGGNCLGIRSVPGRVDTLFIPAFKLPRPRAASSRLALLSQSGAFVASRLSKLAALNPRYTISVGNQLDLTLGDYLTGLSADAEIDVFACYVEGFSPGDGERWIDAAAALRAAGRSVLLYRGGRTAAGARASASHTASIAGDYEVTRELAHTAGVVVAESLADFEDLTQLFESLSGRAARGLRLGAMSNAGFECVALADRLGRFEAAHFGDATRERIETQLLAQRLTTIVDVRNPLDVTPILGDLGFVEVARAILDDEGVDAAVFGCVPLTAALNTVPAGESHAEDLSRPESVVNGFVRLRRESNKPFVVVVDGGSQFDAMVNRLIAGGVPTFRTADRAIRLFEIYCLHGLP